MKKYVLVIAVFATLQNFNSATAQILDTIHTDIVVEGKCTECQTRIESIANTINAVYDAYWEVNDGTLHINHDSTFDSDGLQNSLAMAGHETADYYANEIAFANLPKCCEYTQGQMTTPVTEHNSDTIDGHTDIFVDGICGMCEDRIEAVSDNFKHVTASNWDVDTRILHVDHTEKFNAKALQRAIAAVGHDTEFLKASQTTYNEIHACCKYRDPLLIAEFRPEESIINEVSDIPSDSDVHEEHPVQGIILERDASGNEMPVIGANVYWMGSSTGTTSDADGYFSLIHKNLIDRLVVSYVGFENDTLDVENIEHLEIILSDATFMREVIITHRTKSTGVSMLSVGKMQQLGEKELLKAACCNLSESFDTNPTVDATMTDAVTGTRKIQMLGLAGPNIQMTREGIPDTRGLSVLYGLNFTPGTWIQGININTGTGSVVNGFESITGQIDVSLKKPDQSERLYFNLFGNEMTRMEANLNVAHRFNDKVSTGIMLHYGKIPEKHDNNFDGFLDHPVNDQYVVLNRWKFYGNNGLEGQVGVKLSSLQNNSGQANFNHDKPAEDQTAWGSTIQLKKYEAWAKAGKVFPATPHASIGVQLNASYFDQDSYFGLRTYDGDHTTFYANVIYQSLIKDTRHAFKTGLSFQYDKINELVHTSVYDRSEKVPGGFFEYSYKPHEKFSLVAGLRGDIHNQYGFFMTPRLHMRYAPNEKTAIRFSGGRGQRTASIFAENIGGFATARQFRIIGGDDSDKPYGLDAEQSWSAGFSFVRDFTVNTRSMVFQFDVYHTNFKNQIVVDWDSSPQELSFYNLNGESYSNSVQFQVDYEVIPRFDVRVAYRYNDVKTTYAIGKLEKPLTGRERAFINLQYDTKNNWSFDYTLIRVGEQRLPQTQSNPEKFQVAQNSPSYFMSNTQITKSWNKKFDIYIGAMNLFNYKQPTPIISAEDPYSPYFDSSIVWAPIFGREIYGGIRYRIP